MKYILVICAIMMCFFSMAGCSILNNVLVCSTNEGASNKESIVIGGEPHISNGLFYSDDEQVNQLLEELIMAVEKKDIQVVRTLFAPSAVMKSKNIDTQIEQMFHFFGGKVISVSHTGPISTVERDNVTYTKELEISCDITTDNGGYRLAMKLCTIDSTISDNIGIHSIYIIKSEHSDASFSYWGDGKWSPGIIIEQ